MAVAGRPRDWRSPGSPDRLAPPGEGVRRRARQLLYGKCRRKVVETRAPPDLRRSFSRLCHAAGGELEQIQFQLGHEWLALP